MPKRPTENPPGTRPILVITDDPALEGRPGVKVIGGAKFTSGELRTTTAGAKKKPQKNVGNYGGYGVTVPGEDLVVLSPRGELLSRLRTTTGQIKDLIAEQEQHVQKLREMGVSWRVIGEVLGTTGQAAQQRFKHVSPPRESYRQSAAEPPAP